MIDSNIFYGGIPFQTSSDYVYYITPDIQEEIHHIKRRIDGLNLLITAGKVIIQEPDINIHIYGQTKMCRFRSNGIVKS